MPRLTAVEIKKMRVEILTGAFSLREIGRHFGVSVQTVFRHKKTLNENPDIRAKFQKQLNKILLERDSQRNKSQEREIDTLKNSDNLALREVNQEIEDVTVRRAALMVADVVERHRQLVCDATVGVRRIQQAINEQAEDVDSGTLKELAQAQRQNSGSIVNIINCDRRSYNIDDPSAGDDAPDSVQITFYRDKKPAQIEDIG